MIKLFSSKGKSSKKKTKKPKKPKTKFFGSKKNNSFLDKKFILYICMVAIGTFLIATGLLELFADRREEIAAQEEYEMLYDVFTRRTTITTLPPETVINDDHVESTPDIPDEEGYPSLDELYEMNNDFIGWFSIRGLIEYPVVQGRDNSKYVNYTFMGERNSAGAIFMDYRHKSSWDDTVCIIYGHRTYDGSMFAPLVNYFNPQYLQRNNTIVITTRDGNTLTYKVFAAKETDAWDSAYEASISNPEIASETFPDVPEGASRFLILSTCTRSPDPDERILVFAALAP